MRTEAEEAAPVIRRESSGKQRLDQTRARMICVAFIFILCFLTIAGKLLVTSFTPLDPKVARQMAKHDLDTTQMSIADIIERTTPKDDSPIPHLVMPRRDIVDRNGVVLATSLSTRSLYAHPNELRDKAATAKQLAKILRVDEDQLKRRLTLSTKFAWMKRNLTPVEQAQVNNLGIPGLYFQDESTRVYPQGSLLAHVIGFVDVDGEGIAGVEKSFNEKLLSEGVEGPPITLSVDVRLQHLLSDQLQGAMTEFSAIGAAGAIVHIPDGEVLAMTSLPTFDPHHPGNSDPVALFNRMTMGTYEMGSTFKTFTAAMALDAGTVTLTGGADASAPIHYGGWTISDAHPENRWLTVPEIYLYSSNIGAAKLAMGVGIERQEAFLKSLGMFKRVNIELPERALPLTPNPWNEINLMTISYGHGISVTPLHLVHGVQAMLNGGTFDSLTLLKGGNDEQSHGKRVIKEETSQDIRRMMRAVVQYGTGRKADIPGYRVGGKTGTAEKVKAGGGYAAKAKLASFIGAFPMDNPQYLVLVMLDEPQPTKKTYGFATGGWVAAPAAGNIIGQMGPMLGVEPNPESEQPDQIDQRMAQVQQKEKLTELARIKRVQERGMHVARY